jgi:phospholipase C
MSPLDRRRFLLGAAGVATLAATSPAWATRPGPANQPLAPLPDPDKSGLDHIVVVCMENRSFDHYLGWLPGANGKQAGLSYPDDKGALHPTHHLTEWQGCGFNDPDHSYSGGRVQLDGGKCDGFRKGGNDDYALGYYTKNDLALYGPLVEQATVFDNYFCSILSSTYPNRFYTHAAATDRLDNAMVTSVLPTIWDKLAAKNVSANYYFSDLPFLALWGTKYISLARHIETFFAQAATGTLPSYSYLDPFFLGEDQGGSNDDHPHADIRRGQAFLSLVVQAILNSPLWDRTALVITYDEWGGFFDHVVPPVLPDDHDLNPTSTPHGQAGFRVPAMVLSPFARRGYVGSAQYDHTSILKMVEWRWGLSPLTSRDAAARNLAETFDFAHPDTAVPNLPIVPDPGPHICGAPGVGMATEESFWTGLKTKAAAEGWAVR